MRVALVALLAATLQPLLHSAAAQGAAPAACTRTSGLTLPEGFCAIVVARDVGRTRNVTVSPAGDVYVALANGGIAALRDANGDGIAEEIKKFGDDDGTGILWHDGELWFAANTKILRWKLPSGTLVPEGNPETIVDGLPNGGHFAKTIARLGGDTLIVAIGSATNSCQRSDRSARSPGIDPCTELETRGGLWQFSAARAGQKEADGKRFATGLRNPEAIAVEPGSGRLYASPHGRDQLSANWGYTDEQNAELPAEEFVQVEPGDDFGWPYCYYDWQKERKVLSPEYGGDGEKVGRCSDKKAPLLGLPGHWAPMAIAFNGGRQFPSEYAGGAFIAFRGSWNRAPLPQAGYRVEFVPFRDGRPTGTHSRFAASASGETGLRATGVAFGPDGSLYISGENSGTIWRVMAQ
ncbi:MAG TPA: PQQ-dependent sugar dehydrogenase [Gemmatimonadales bacterium]|nr:PQQ-dependent sugar dehydrogenase [Gemmatimonadales bacterium]